MARNGQEFAQSLSAPFMLNHPEVSFTYSSVCCLLIILFYFFKCAFKFSLLLLSHTVWLDVGRQGECVRLHASHREDQGVQCELELSRPAQCRGAGRNNGQTGRVSLLKMDAWL